jgi:hypothetical protein
LAGSVRTHAECAPMTACRVESRTRVDARRILEQGSVY